MDNLVVLIGGVFLLGSLGVAAVQPAMEANTFNRLTGKDATYFDAGLLYAAVVFSKSVLKVDESKEELTGLLITILGVLSLLFGIIWPLGIALDIYSETSKQGDK